MVEAKQTWIEPLVSVQALLEQRTCQQSSRIQQIYPHGTLYHAILDSEVHKNQIHDTC